MILELLNNMIQNATKTFHAKKYEEAAQIVQQIVSNHSLNMTPEVKHQLGIYLLHSTRNREALPLIDVEKLNEHQLHDLVWLFQAVWDTRLANTEVVDMGRPAEQICRLLKRYVSETNQTVAVMHCAGFYCYRYEMATEAVACYEKAMATVGNATLEQVSLFEQYRAFSGMTKIQTGDPSGDNDVLTACKNLLSRIPKHHLNPQGKDTYEIQYLDRMTGFPNTTIYRKSVANKLLINPLIPPNSALGFPQITQLEDRDVQLVEISDVFQVVFGVFWRKNNDFIVYDSGHYGAVEVFTNKAAIPHNLSAMPLNTLEDAVFTCAHFRNYYHWLVEGLARLVYLLDTGFFENNPKAVVPIFDMPFVTQSLALINFPPGKIKTIKFIPNALTFYRRLHVPAFVPWDSPDLLLLNPSQMHLPPPHLIRLLNKYLNPKPLPLELRRKIVYVGRTEANARKTLFDSRLIPELKKLFGDDLIVFPDPAPSVSKQREIFSTARIIVGPHGAGLSNIIFAAPNQTAVIVFPVKTIQFDPPFANLAASLGMYFWTLPAVTSHYATDYQNSEESVAAILQAVLQVSSFMNNLQ